MNRAAFIVTTELLASHMQQAKMLSASKSVNVGVTSYVVAIVAEKGD
jgi:hypothetical protein